MDSGISERDRKINIKLLQLIDKYNAKFSTEVNELIGTNYIGPNTRTYDRLSGLYRVIAQPKKGNKELGYGITTSLVDMVGLEHDLFFESYNEYVRYMADYLFLKRLDDSQITNAKKKSTFLKYDISDQARVAYAGIASKHFKETIMFGLKNIVDTTGKTETVEYVFLKEIMDKYEDVFNIIKIPFPVVGRKYNPHNFFIDIRTDMKKIGEEMDKMDNEIAKKFGTSINFGAKYKLVANVLAHYELLFSLSGYSIDEEGNTYKKTHVEPDMVDDITLLHNNMMSSFEKLEHHVFYSELKKNDQLRLDETIDLRNSILELSKSIVKNDILMSNEVRNVVYAINDPDANDFIRTYDRIKFGNIIYQDGWWKGLKSYFDTENKETKNSDTDITNKPSPADITNKPSPADITNKPSPADITNKPSPADITNNPTPADITNANINNIFTSNIKMGDKSKSDNALEQLSFKYIANNGHTIVVSGQEARDLIMQIHRLNVKEARSGNLAVRNAPKLNTKHDDFNHGAHLDSFGRLSLIFEELDKTNGYTIDNIELINEFLEAPKKKKSRDNIVKVQQQIMDKKISEETATTGKPTAELLRKMVEHGSSGINQETKGKKGTQIILPDKTGARIGKTQKLSLSDESIDILVSDSINNFSPIYGLENLDKDTTDKMIKKYNAKIINLYDKYGLDRKNAPLITGIKKEYATKKLNGKIPIVLDELKSYGEIITMDDDNFNLRIKNKYGLDLGDINGVANFIQNNKMDKEGRNKILALLNDINARSLYKTNERSMPFPTYDETKFRDNIENMGIQRTKTKGKKKSYFDTIKVIYEPKTDIQTKPADPLKQIEYAGTRIFKDLPDDIKKDGDFTDALNAMNKRLIPNPAILNLNDEQINQINDKFIDVMDDAFFYETGSYLADATKTDKAIIKQIFIDKYGPLLDLEQYSSNPAEYKKQYYDLFNDMYGVELGKFSKLPIEPPKVSGFQAPIKKEPTEQEKLAMAGVQGFTPEEIMKLGEEKKEAEGENVQDPRTGANLDGNKPRGQIRAHYALANVDEVNESKEQEIEDLENWNLFNLVINEGNQGGGTLEGNELVQYENSNDKFLLKGALLEDDYSVDNYTINDGASWIPRPFMDRNEIDNTLEFINIVPDDLGESLLRALEIPFKTEINTREEIDHFRDSVIPTFENPYEDFSEENVIGPYPSQFTKNINYYVVP